MRGGLWPAAATSPERRFGGGALGAIAVVAVAASGCSDPKAVAAARAYEATACACTTPKCADDAENEFAASARPGRFMSSADKAEFVRAARHGEECAEKLADPSCGGEEGRACPAGYKCVMPADPEPDAMGTCQRVDRE